MIVCVRAGLLVVVLVRRAVEGSDVGPVVVAVVGVIVERITVVAVTVELVLEPAPVCPVDDPSWMPAVLVVIVVVVVVILVVSTGAGVVAVVAIGLLVVLSTGTGVIVVVNVVDATDDVVGVADVEVTAIVVVDTVVGSAPERVVES